MAKKAKPRPRLLDQNDLLKQLISNLSDPPDFLVNLLEDDYAAKLGVGEMGALIRIMESAGYTLVNLKNLADQQEFSRVLKQGNFIELRVNEITDWL